MFSHDVAFKIAEWCQIKAFDIDAVIKNIRYLKYHHTNYPDPDKASHQIHKDCSEYILNFYNSKNILIEEQIKIKTSASDLRFNYFIPAEGTAIELCCSVIENELEKDITKAHLDQRVKKLIIIATNKIYHAKKKILVIENTMLKKHGIEKGIF